MRQTTKGTLPGGKAPGGGGDLMRAKMALVAACERGEPDALGHVLATYPAHIPELIEFSVALRATSGYEHEALTAQSAAVAERALDRAMAAVFGGETPAAAPVTTPRVTVAAASVAQGVVATLKGLRRARKLSPRELADRVGLGVDVVSTLEHGLIRAASVPERLVKALADALGANLDQVTTALNAQQAIVPAF
ncbi:MAG TPA: helix-turn-helix transcriptional regulator, partial [Ktedonobacterales bacterium]|nr:helix-turn-helix transcriptional regulator [Ktedonobacterales bacterium]